jgi:hypothetical protein
MHRRETNNKIETEVDIFYLYSRSYYTDLGCPVIEVSSF